MSESVVRILDAHGQPMKPTRRGARALAGGNLTPYDAADVYGQNMAAWQPFLPSADGELNAYRDRIVSRARDLARNDGWASGAVTRILDNAIGANLRPISKPDYRALAAFSGNKGFDHVWAKEYARAIDAHWRTWSDDPGRYCDATRTQTFGQMMRVAFRHKLIDNDALAILLWLPERLGRGKARYCTTVQLVDPDRLCNPNMSFDTLTIRGGVEIDDLGAAVAFHFRRAHQGDYFTAASSQTWERVEREQPWGRPIVVHDFDHDRIGQHRGGAGIFTPVMQRLKMLIKYDGVELDAAIINAIFAAYIESPFDQQLVQQAMGDDADIADGGNTVGTYQDMRADFHAERNITLGGARIPIMFPGEKINAVSAVRPTSNFGAFEGAVLRNFASGVGLSAQQVSNDWSDVNYSSARASLLEAWKTLSRRRHDFAMGFASPIRSAMLEESHEVDDLPMPSSGWVPDYVDCRASYSRCRWMGPGRGVIDPTAEREGSILGLESCLTTLEDELGDQGLDYEETLEQRRHELDRMEELGLPMPEWAAQIMAARASARAAPAPQATAARQQVR